MSNSNERYDPKQVDDYQYDQEMGPIRRFLWFCAGADEQILKRCPHSERVKEEGIGGVVLATTVLAFLSSSYAFYTIFGPKVGYALDPDRISNPFFWGAVSIACGIVWALIIFNLDRFIVTSTGHGDGTSNITLGEFGRAIPRLLMAIIIGLTLAAPLEIRVFKSEIDAELHSLQQAQTEKNTVARKAKFEEQKKHISAKIDSLNVLLDSGRNNLQKKINQVRSAQVSLDAEATGGSGTGARGIGPVYKHLEQNLIQTQAQLDQEKNEWNNKKEPKIQREIKLAEEKYNAATKAYEKFEHNEYLKAASIDGLGKRIELAHKLFFWPSLFLILLLMIIEITPVLIKMMLIRGPYDYLTANQNEILNAKHIIEIQESTETDENENMNLRITEIFHQAESIITNEKNKLETEANLAKAVLKSFEERILQHISQHPEDYLDGIPKVPADEGKST